MHMERVREDCNQESQKKNLMGISEKLWRPTIATLKTIIVESCQKKISICSKPHLFTPATCCFTYYRSFIPYLLKCFYDCIIRYSIETTSRDEKFLTLSDQLQRDSLLYTTLEIVNVEMWERGFKFGKLDLYHVVMRLNSSSWNHPHHRLSLWMD